VLDKRTVKARVDVGDGIGGEDAEGDHVGKNDWRVGLAVRTGRGQLRRALCKRHRPGISGRRNLETMALCEMVVRSVRERRIILREELGS
jgi:hypothetical protein